MSKKPTRIILEITGQGWVKRIYAGALLISELQMEMYSESGAKSTKSGYDAFKEICDDDTDGPLGDIAEAFDDLDGFDIAQALYELATPE